jgi:putative heme-binding domain-containing protein
MRKILLLSFGLACFSQAAEWQTLFNGRDLAGWSGDPRLWRVENGTLIGETDAADRKIAANSFLIWEGGQPADFILEFKARVTGKNNSGVQYRSKRPAPDGWVLKGYQFDLHPAKDYLGMLYEEGGRGIACTRGQKVDLRDKPEVTGKLDVADVRLDEWNSFRVVARGNVLRHFVNGKPAAEIRDLQEQKRAMQGFIGLQVHAGPPMKAEFKDIRWRPLVKDEPEPEAGADEKDQAPEDLTSAYTVAPGFKLERIYQVPKSKGSWVSITARDDDGSFYCADQHGSIYRVFPPGPGQPLTRARPTGIELGGAHGLLWHDGTLWVSVNEGPSASGLWKVTDSNGDGDPDHPEMIQALRGRGEHGPHSLVPSPDGKWIYLICGNHTDVPDFENSLVPKVWQEDQLLPRRPDARGHASNRMAPGGWVARFTPDGKNWQLFSVGYRNAFDLAFNEHGDLFTYDSDMEWDLGMPWYRPTRINHVTPGSEFGWRNGTGKWPDVYEDSMPSQLDIGPGSPTGLVSGRSARFPEKYQRAIFALDWTFATIYAIHLTPDGDSYQADREEFLAGSGLPLTDAIIGADGAMYFLTGGRRSGSALWRVSHHQAAEITPSVTYQAKTLDPMPAADALANLGSPHRVTRHQARVALETQGPQTLADALSKARDPWQVITAAIGLARTGTPAHVPAILDALDSLPWDPLDTAQKVNWLRAAGLVFARHGPPDAASRAKVLAKIDSSFPARDELLNRELCRMLSFLNAPGVVGRTLALMDSAGPGAPPDWLALAKRNAHYGRAVESMISKLPPAQVIHYIYCLRVVPGPWQEDERRRFFAWFPKLADRAGGASYAGFINDLRDQTLATSTPEEREWISELIKQPAHNPFANLPRPKGPGRAWTIDEVEQLAKAGFDSSDRANGKIMFQAALCSTCHRFGGDGGASGPDLTNVAGRFSARDLAEAILDPGKVISDQYEFTQITRNDGSTLLGRIMSEADGNTLVSSNPYDYSQTLAIPTASITSRQASPISPMPPGLIHALNPEELRDLLAYLLDPK